MAEMLLINPAKRRKVKRAAKRSARRVARRKTNPNSPTRRRARAVNPAPRRRRAVVRTINPIKSGRRRRRSNPITIGNVGRSLVAMTKDAALGAAGAVGVDLLMGQANRFLPASLQSAPGQIGAGTVVKGVVTVVAGKLLSKMTRGASVKMAQGALTVQMHQIASGFLPAGLALGYANPAMMINRSARVGPIRGPLQNGMGAYVAGPSPMLNRAPQGRIGAYVSGPSPMLRGAGSSMAAREGQRR